MVKGSQAATATRREAKRPRPTRRISVSAVAKATSFRQRALALGIDVADLHGMKKDCSGRAVKAAAGYMVSGPGSIPAAPTSRDSLMTALGAGNKYPEAQGLGLGKPRFFLKFKV